MMDVNDLTDRDIEIARLRSQLAEARAELEVARQYPYCVGYDRGKEHLRPELDRTAAQLAEVREALVSLVEEFERLTRYGSPFAKANNPRIVAAKAALARLSSPGAQQRAGEDVWRHKKRGSTYKIVGEAQVQAETPLTDYECVTVYRCLQSGELWVRRNSEFHDGRFELVTAADPAAPGAEE